MRLLNSIIIILLLCNISCSGYNQKEESYTYNNPTVTIIFKDAPQQNSSEYFRGLRRNPEYTIAYVDTLLHKHLY